MNRKEAEEEKIQNTRDKNNFTKPKNKQRANRRRNTKGNTDRNYFSNPFEILDLETDSEEKQNMLNREEGQENPEKPTREGRTDETMTGEILMQDRIVETEEETNMLTS